MASTQRGESVCYDPEEAQRNSTMVRHAQRRIAIVDHSKFGVVAGWRICGTSELQILITDSGATDEMVAPFEKAGSQVMRV